MSTSLRVLLAEDSEDDALILLSELREGGYDPGYERVETAAEMKVALERGGWDIVISDHSMIGFTSLDALALLRATGLDLPFIIVSGTIGEEMAVKAMKAGAHDFVLKGNLARLIPAVERELREAMERRARKRAEERVHESEANLAAAQRITHLGSWELDLGDSSDLNKSPLRWSDETFRIFGYQPGGIEVTNDNFFNAVHPDDRANIRDAIAKAIAEGTPYCVEHRIIRPDGSERIVQEMSDIGYDPQTGRPSKMVGTVQDITDRKRDEAQIEYLATHDVLTGLPNRYLLNDRIAQFIARTPRTGKKIAVLFLDIDRFKLINDSFGHTAGDALLNGVARRIKESVREGDTVARLGGDEFVVVLEDLQESKDAADIARKLLGSISRPLPIDGHELRVTASIGISMYPHDGDNGAILLRNADTAMYRAKNRGRNAVEFYTREMSRDAQERVELESALYHALENHEFELHYQPQVSLRNGQVTGVEALIRWQHPKLGLVTPGRFIPLAEATGAIVPIGEWVLRTACRQMKEWHIAGHHDLSIAVNLSARQFHQQNITNLVGRVLAETGLTPHCLEIDVTESTLMQNNEAVDETLEQLKTMGVMLSLDDFGTGYSSSRYVKRLPIDILKIDKSFIDDVTRSGEDMAIVKVIIDMARALGMQTIAEGVETGDQVGSLLPSECDALQGYYFSRPLPADGLTALLQKGKRLPVERWQTKNRGKTSPLAKTQRTTRRPSRLQG